MADVLRQSYAEKNGRWLALYAGCMGLMVMVMLVGGALMAALRVRIAARLHGAMLRSITLAPISFFDVTPLGRIMNRFSKEQNQVDMMMTVMVAWTFVTINFVLVAFLAIIIATKGVFLAVLIPLGPS